MKKALIVVFILLCCAALLPAQSTKKLSGEITVWYFEYEINSKEDMQYIAGKFMEVNPTVKVNLESPPIDQYHDRLITAIGAGEAPDLAMNATAWMTELANAGSLVNWETVTPKAFIGSMVQNMLETGRFKGGLYGLPYLATSRAMFINNDIYKKAGVKPADTWDQFIKAAQKTTSAADGTYGLALQGAGVENFAAWFLYFLWSYGGEVFNQKGELIINSPEGVKALTLMGDLVNKYKVTQPNVTGTDLAEQLNLFKSGKAGATITGPWMIGILKSDAPGLPYSVVPIPRGDKRVTLGVTDSLVLFKDGKNQDAAVEFAKFFMSADMHTRWVSGRGMIPVVQASAKNPVFTQNKNLKVFLDLLPQARFAPMDPRWTRIMEEGGKALQSVYLNQASPKDALDKAVQNVNSAQ
jgi:multiple sugar transport system substrate-binding protein